MISKSLRGSACGLVIAQTLLVMTGRAQDPSTSMKVPRFSVEHMDRSVDPGEDFFRYASGNWLKQNPVPGDKPSWGAMTELRERNQQLLHLILERSAKSSAAPHLPERQVGNFFLSGMDTNKLEELGLEPLQADLKRIAGINSVGDLMKLTAELQMQGVGLLFGASAIADEKKSSIYAFYLGQGGLGLPDREYYLSTNFSKQREAYVDHMGRMFGFLGDAEVSAGSAARTVLSLETELAKVSKSRVDLRDRLANYHKFSTAEMFAKHPGLGLKDFLTASGLGELQEMVVRQPAFFSRLEELLKERPLEDWKQYFRWHLLRSSASYLNTKLETESFKFYGTVLNGMPDQEPRWQRVSATIDRELGEALGELYVREYFPPAARARMNELIENLKVVFRARLQNLDWMTETTRQKGLAKFDRFTQKIGHPEKFRDYFKVEIRPGDYFGNIRRGEIFETRRQYDRIGKPVDKSEWIMTPQTVNAYFSPMKNEIVFPAGILQPPFFDLEGDDAVNYGAIGYIIGHEITHGFDDQGRKYDVEGNLNDWWTEADGKAFDARAQKLVDQYDSYEALPGLNVNGKLSLGENIADLGGASIAYEALQRALAKDPSKRKKIDGFTPEQRYFLSMSQVWRINWREAALRRQLTVGPHSPGQFRAVGPHVNLTEFYEAFSIKSGAKMWRAPKLRAQIW